MVTNRIFICHVIRSEKPEEERILHYVMETLGKTGMEILTYKGDSPEESFFEQLQQELSTCQTFIILQTPDVVNTPRIHIAVNAAKKLFDQKKLQGLFLFICPSATEVKTPKEWEGLTTFDGTHDYQRACTKLVLHILAKNNSRTSNVVLEQMATKNAILPIYPVAGHKAALDDNTTKYVNKPLLQTNFVDAANSSIPLVPLDVIPTSAMPALGTGSTMDKPSQTVFTNSVNGSTPLESVSTSVPRSSRSVGIVERPSQINFTQTSKSPEIVATNALPALRRKNPPKKPARTNYDRPPKPSIWQRLGEQRKLLSVIAIALVILALIGSAGTFFFLNANSPKPVVQVAAPNTQAPTPVATPPPNPTIGQASFFGSDQIGVDNNTGIADEVQVNLQHITSPSAGNSYYAWLLPNPGNTVEGKNLLLGPLTVNNGSATLNFANPTHANLLLTETTFLVTEESANPAPSIPSPDQRTWRYYGSIPQTPNPDDPNHLSKLDHIRHLLAADPALQALNLQGGLSTWFYTNVQQVFTLANTTEGSGQQQNVYALHNTLVRILDYLDGTNNVAGDVPQGTPFLIQPPETARIPLLTLDPAQQNPLGFIDHLETHLQGLTASSGTRHADQKLAAQVDNEFQNINTHLQKVRDDAKQLANLSTADLAGPNTAPMLVDMVDNANAAFVGDLNPATNKRQGGATFVHDVLPQFATIDVKEFRGL